MLYYSVVQDYQGKWHVTSYLCDNKTDERRAALTSNRRCVLTTTDHDAAQRRAAEMRAQQPASK
jgi:hypothetical protein